MRTFLLSVILTWITSLSVTGQIYYKPTPVGPYTANSCNNTIVCEAFNLPQQGWMELVDGSGNYIQNVNNQDTINNFCTTDSNFPIAGYKIDFYSSNGYLNHYQLTSTVIPPSLNYTITNYSAPTSDTTLDGSLTISFDSLNVLSNYGISYSQSSNTPDTVMVNATDLQFDSLSNGYLQLYITNPVDSSDFAYFRVYVGDPADIYVNTGLYVSVSFQHADNNCNGWISLVAPSPTGNVLNTWSDGPYNQMYRSGLCPGVYSAYTYDDAGAGGIVGASIDTVVITNNNTAYIDSSIYTYPVTDTTYLNFTSCQFDFNAPIDSVFYNEDTLYNNGGILIVNFVMTMYQGNSYVTVTDSLVTVNGSMIMLDVVLYCTQFKSAFKGQRIVYLRGASDHNFYQNGLSLAEQEEYEFRVYPNPTDGKINLFSEGLPSYKRIRVTDSRGRNLIELVNTEENSIDLSTYDNGIYYVNVELEDRTLVYKVIKE